MRHWHIETRNIEDLTEHPRNPRYLTKEEGKHLMTSIAKFGLIDKPIITSENQVIGGHQRLKILKKLGHEAVECWVSDEGELTDDEVDELCIRLNKNVGDWDWDRLANEWNVNDLLEWGFEEKDFDECLGKIKNPKIIFEFDDKDEIEEFLELVNQFPSRENGNWGFKMKMKNCG
jgi:ParB-like chromosome segregation protein Spo0J